MIRRFGLYGPLSRDFLTWGGRILWHTDAAELAFLVPLGAVVRELPADIPADQTLHIGSHPAMAAVQWPLTREQFTRSAT